MPGFFCAVDGRPYSADHNAMPRWGWIVLIVLAVVVWAVATGRAKPLTSFLQDSPGKLIPVGQEGE